MYRHLFMRRKLIALAVLSFSTVAALSQTPAPQGHTVTVVTLYSETRPAPGQAVTTEKPAQPPIQIVDGGVKSAGQSCWEMDAKGNIVTTPGDCYILRSAAAGEHPPSPAH